MASRTEKNSFMEEFLFKEKEGKPFVFKKTCILTVNVFVAFSSWNAKKVQLPRL